MRVAIISDTVDNIDGVAIGLRRLVAAGRRSGRSMTLIGPAGNADIVDDVVRIPAAMSAALPMYPQYTWSVPELPALTTWLAKNADIVQLATPGPMGMAALIAARMLKLPVIAQYHTEVPDYAARLTGMPFVKGLVEPFVGWFYQQADLCLAPSQAVEDRLRGLGITRIQRVRRGTDLALFSPEKRVAGPPTALYVGRISKEKNIDVLRDAWAQIHAKRPDAILRVAGDGPVALDGPGIVRLGVLHGEDLAREFASADVFIFPSETETFGNVVVEAAASGLPAIVSSKGASHEHVTRETGVIADGAAAIAREVLALFDDPDRRARMSRAAREHALAYDLDAALTATWEIYRSLKAPLAVAS
ncbi:MAG: glycosyltransferase [Kofleriaceae bacterium]